MIAWKKGVAAVVSVGCLSVVAFRVYLFHARALRESQPILITGINEPAEMRVPPMPVPYLTPPEKMVVQAMESTGTKGGPSVSFPAMSRIIAKYPNDAEAYVFRLGSLCEGTNLDAIISDVDHALPLLSRSSFVGDSAPALYSIRAKVEYDRGEGDRALDDLERAIRADLRKATDFANSGGSQPETNAKTCTWTEPDVTTLVKHHSNDYRAFMAQGLYYSFFEMFKPKPEMVNLAIRAFGKASDLNKKSALPEFFLTQALSRAYTFKRISMSDEQRAGLNEAIVKGMSNALARDPNLLPALEDRAQAYFELKKYHEAISDFDRRLVINPKDAGAYNDRALAKINTGDLYAAISDFGKAIENKRRELRESSSYEGRADAYMKTKQWDLAIADLDTAISLQAGGALILSSIEQFRGIYPEYKTASDEAIAHKLQETFYPEMKYADFASDFLHKEISHQFFEFEVITDLYINRCDAYLKAGRWHEAAVDFRRIMTGYPGIANSIQRWREIGSKDNEHTFVDMRTFDDSRPESVRLWAKQKEGAPDNAAPYSIQEYELNCTTRQIRLLSFANYNANGDATASREGGEWRSIVPDSMAETLAAGTCRSK